MLGCVVGLDAHAQGPVAERIGGPRVLHKDWEPSRRDRLKRLWRLFLCQDIGPQSCVSNGVSKWTKDRVEVTSPLSFVFLLP